MLCGSCYLMPHDFPRRAYQLPELPAENKHGGFTTTLPALNIMVCSVVLGVKCIL